MLTCGLCPVCFRPLCHCMISTEALTLFFCCLASALFSSGNANALVFVVSQSVWLLYSASAGVGRLLAETLWCSAHVISLISLCVCASRWVLHSDSGEHVNTHLRLIVCTAVWTAHIQYLLSYFHSQTLFHLSAFQISAFGSRCGIKGHLNYASVCYSLHAVTAADLQALLWLLLMLRAWVLFKSVTQSIKLLCITCNVHAADVNYTSDVLLLCCRFNTFFWCVKLWNNILH